MVPLFKLSKFECTSCRVKSGNSIKVYTRQQTKSQNATFSLWYVISLTNIGKKFCNGLSRCLTQSCLCNIIADPPPPNKPSERLISEKGAGLRADYSGSDQLSLSCWFLVMLLLLHQLWESAGNRMAVASSLRNPLYLMVF